jgi:hypothetical protein
MFGFGIILMHLADYFARRKYDEQRKKNDEVKQQQVRDSTRQCVICGKDFATEIELETHIKESHPSNTI